MLYIYNTLTAVKEEFKPLHRELVKVYVCGPTVYDKTHLGHARTYIAFDIVRRYLEFLGYNVLQIVNITDIDDKIIRKSIETGKEWREIAEENMRNFFNAIDKLNIRRAHIYPRVTEHIDDIVKFIEKLIENGYAYEAEGNVYFDVDKFVDYGKLSKVKRDKLKPQEEMNGKRKPYDFALWKKAKPMEPCWESPWGKGRPGWHIECSVMASKYLGSQFDIHGGGQDLIFPHHENEIAQSEAFFKKKPWVKYWMHTGMLMIGEEKMSKSLGNVITIEELTRKYKPMELRFYIINSHYRSPITFRENLLEQAKRAYNRILESILTLKSILKGKITYRENEESIEELKRIIKLRRNFLNAMNDDFDTPRAIARLHELTTLVNKEIIPGEKIVAAEFAMKVFFEASKILGVFEEAFKENLESNLTYKLIDLLLKVRQKHRLRREWEIADWIAREIRKLGVEISDNGRKTTWRLKRF